jgi:hypothetical protein
MPWLTGLAQSVSISVQSSNFFSWGRLIFSNTDVQALSFDIELLLKQRWAIKYRIKKFSDEEFIEVITRIDKINGLLKYLMVTYTG